MKKIIVSFLTAAIASLSLSSVMTANAVSQSKTFRIYYDVEASSGISNMTSSLKYDYSKVEVKKVIKGNLGGTHGFSQTENGIMDVTYRNTSNLNAAGTLMYVSFDAPESISNLRNYVNYSNSAKSTTGTNLSSKVSTKFILVGDVDNDGEIKSNDVLLLQKYLLGTQKLEDEQWKAADVNGDLDVTEDDLALLKKYQLGTLLNFDR